MTPRRLYSPQSIAFQFACTVVRRLVDAGFVAYFAGGCVRDALLNIAPSDFDVATSASSEQVRSLFGSKNTLAVGEAFGVILVRGRIEGTKSQVEVATFRSDGTYSDGRRPDWVVYSTPEEDAQRRDFTVNGLFYDPIAERVLDYVAGEDDLQRRILRAIGSPNARIEEDKLRMLRAIRFAARFALTIDNETRQAIVRHATTITQVSGERVGVEMNKILSHPQRVWAWRELMDTGLLSHILPEWYPACNDTDGSAHSVSPLSEHSDREGGIQLLMHLPSRAIAAETAIGAIFQPWYERLYGMNPSAAKEPFDTLLHALKNRWKLSNREIDAIRFAVVHAGMLVDATQHPWSCIQPLLTSPWVEHALDIAEATTALKGVPATGIAYCRSRLKEPVEQWDPRPWLDGSDLIRAGLRPGPDFSKILSEARSKQLDNELPSREAAIDWLEGQIQAIDKPIEKRPAGN
jgi:tRNA nucleotidyltransferase/poly(A) polymerase